MHALLKNVLAGTTALLLATSSTALAQVGLTSNVATVALTATKAATLTVTPNASTATLASITDNSTANDFTPVSLTTSWNLTAGSSVRLIGWFATPAQALINGTSFIPAAKVLGRVGATA